MDDFCNDLKDGNCNPNSLDYEKYLFERQKFVWDKIKFQRGVMDKYFYYFLLFITTPIAALVTITNSNFDTYRIFIVVISFILSLIGVIFFFMYINQRVNSIQLVDELKKYDGILKKVNSEIIYKNNGYKKRGADFWVSVLQGLVSCLWFGIGSYIILDKLLISCLDFVGVDLRPKIYVLCPIYFSFVLSIFIFIYLMYIRNKILADYEN